MSWWGGNRLTHRGVYDISSLFDKYVSGAFEGETSTVKKVKPSQKKAKVFIFYENYINCYKWG